MEEFRKVYSTSQQFLLLQAYVDEVLTEAELLNFMLLEDSMHVPLVFYKQGLLVITPAFDLNQFSHVFIPAVSLQLSTEDKQLIVISNQGHWEVILEDEAEAEDIIQELQFVFQTAKS